MSDNLARDWNMPVRVLLDDGSHIPVFPRRTIAAVETAREWSTIWHYDAEGLIEQVHINAEIAHVRDALGLDDGE